MYGYIYKTTNLDNGLIYVGQKHSPKFLAEKYLGSGKLLKAAVEKHGKEKFIVELLDTAETAEDLDEKEIYWIAKLNSTDHTIGYNICEGGVVNRTMVGKNNPFYGKTHAEDVVDQIKQANSIQQQNPINQELHRQNTKLGMQRQQNSLSKATQQEYIEACTKRNHGENNPMYGKHMSEESKKLMSLRRAEYLKNLPDDWVDPAQTPEAKAKRSNSLKGHVVSEETRQKLREFNQAHCQVHNDYEKLQILKVDLEIYLARGYTVGIGGKSTSNNIDVK